MRKCLVALGCALLMATACTPPSVGPPSTPGSSNILSRICDNQDTIRTAENAVIANANTFITDIRIRMAVIATANAKLLLLAQCPPHDPPSSAAPPADPG